MIEKINRRATFELFFSLLIITSYFLPWVDMALFVKVIGWDLVQVQESLSEMSKDFTYDTNTNNYLKLIYITPFLALISTLACILLEIKIARTILTITSIIGIGISSLVFYNIPNIGFGIIMLFTTCILAIAYSIIAFIKK